VTMDEIVSSIASTFYLGRPQEFERAPFWAHGLYKSSALLAAIANYIYLIHNHTMDQYELDDAYMHNPFQRERNPHQPPILDSFTFKIMEGAYPNPERCLRCAVPDFCHPMTCLQRCHEESTFSLRARDHLWPYRVVGVFGIFIDYSHEEYRLLVEYLKEFKLHSYFPTTLYSEDTEFFFGDRGLTSRHPGEILMALPGPAKPQPGLTPYVYGTSKGRRRAKRPYAYEKCCQPCKVTLPPPPECRWKAVQAIIDSHPLRVEHRKQSDITGVTPGVSQASTAGDSSILKGGMVPLSTKPTRVRDECEVHGMSCSRGDPSCICGSEEIRVPCDTHCIWVRSQDDRICDP